MSEYRQELLSMKIVRRGAETFYRTGRTTDDAVEFINGEKSLWLALEPVCYKGTSQTFMAYLAEWDVMHDAVWFRPRRFLWWRWETWYWRDDIELVHSERYSCRRPA